MNDVPQCPALSRRSVLFGAATIAATGASYARAQELSSKPSVVRSRDGRDVQVFTWQPRGTRRGTILFSHGFGLGPTKYTNLVQPWADAGFLVLAPLHRDAGDHPDHAHFLPAQTLPTRLFDIHATASLVANTPYVVAGHSYGGLIALTLGGAKPVMPPDVLPPMSDPNAKAVLAFSPPGPMPGLITQQTYASVSVPMLVQTGDHDFPIADGKPGDWHVHLSAFEAAPSKESFALALPGVDHFFGNIYGRPERPGPPMTAQFTEAMAVSVLFLRGFGAGDEKARMALAARTDLLKKS